ncbi:MAG: hypothetical protein JJ975_10105 [Bacteroidia bacterium]|nr:hypothetical protein [Bacteroidia bacterium]
MKPQNCTNYIFLLVLLSTLVSCKQLSESTASNDAVLNGSFETIEAGYPVNWNIYSSKTVPEGRFEVLLDSTDPQDGNVCLKFEVDSCSDKGGRFSPGLFSEVETKTGHTYKVSYYIQNAGCKYRVKTGMITNKNSQIKTFIRQPGRDHEWVRHEHLIKIEQGFDRLRFELNVLSPGSLRLDNISIEEVDKQSAG